MLIIVFLKVLGTGPSQAFYTALRPIKLNRKSDSNMGSKLSYQEYCAEDLDSESAVSSPNEVKLHAFSPISDDLIDIKLHLSMSNTGATAEFM